VLDWIWNAAESCFPMPTSMTTSST
jgi:hypothetical protein